MVSREILGVRVDFGMNINEVLDICENKFLKDGKTHHICTTNPEFVMDAQKDSEFKRILNDANLSVPDGAGVIYAKNYLGKIKYFEKDFLFPAKAFLYGTFMGLSSVFSRKSIFDEKITGVDLAYKICELSSQKGYSVFFLGGREKNVLGKYVEQGDRDLATLAAEEMKRRYPGLNVVGATSKFDRERKDDNKTIEYIKNCMNEKGVDHIDFLFVAYGHRYQEKWIVRNSYKIPAKISIGCGGTIDYIVGHCELPPDIYVKKNLGWVYRLIKQPWRVKRIFKAFPVFPFKVFTDSIR